MLRMFCIVATLLSIVRCGSVPVAPEDAILGTWKLTLARNEPVTANYSLVFGKNGVYTFINTIFDGSQISTPGSWRIENRTLYLDSLDFGFSVDKVELTLYARDGTVFVYTKQ